MMMYLYYRRRSKKRSMEMRKYVENLAFQVDDASKSSLVNFPLPTMILRLDTGEVIWDNDGFSQMTGGHEKFFESHITDTIPGFDSRWIMEGKTVCPYDVELLGRKYNIYGTIVRSGVDKNRGILATLFWVDVTDYSILRDKYEQSRPVVALIIIDSYQELYKDLSEGEKSTLTAEIDSRITGWAEQAGGIIRRLERDRYLFVCENQNLITYTADKFSILEQMHEVKNSEGITATLSIGIGKGDYSLSELYKFASIGIDMALSRGGDQVVIKTKTAFEFYGGRTKELEKRTKVKSRVMANALVQLIRDSSYVFVMGHRFSDLDSV
ncbi:MAG: DHH family phosphoesterase, partial [Angelakisella sp.]